MRDATPAPEENGAAAVRELLPTLGRLAAEGYTYEPSPTQLVAMHTLDPRSLHKVGARSPHTCIRVCMCTCACARVYAAALCAP